LRLPTIAVHVRRGDYVDLKKSFGLLDEPYYVEALKRLQTAFPEARIWLFSDNVELVKASFTHPIWKSALWFQNDLDPIETMLLISNCDGLVLSNSTFSYWSALLSKRNALTVVPETWFRRLDCPEQLIPPSWMTVPSRWVS
jgi:hypothetical protein